MLPQPRDALIGQVLTPEKPRSLQGSSAFALAAAAQRGLAFLLLPVYTTALSAAAYGRLSVLTAVYGCGCVLFAFGLEGSLFRRFFQLEGDPVAQRAFVQSIWVVSALAAISLASIVAVGVLFFLPDGDLNNSGQTALAVVAAGLFAAGYTVPATTLRAEQRLRDFLAFSAVAGVSLVVTVIVFVFALELGTLGWTLAMILTNVLCLGTSMFLLPWRRLEHFDREGVRDALRVGLPLVPHSVSLWALQLADRLLLSVLVSAAALGAYGLGSNLAIPALVLVVALNQGFLPQYARARYNSEARRALDDVITTQSVLVLAIGCLTAVVGPPVASVLAPDYVGAEAIIPWAALGYVFMGLYLIPMNGIGLIAGRTGLVWILTLTAAAVNLGIIWVCVPRLGLEWAGIASAVAYATLLLLVTGYGRLLEVPLRRDWGRLGRVVLVSLCTYAFAALICRDAGLVGLAEHVAVALSLGVTIPAACGTTPRQMWALVRRDRSSSGVVR